MGALHVVDVHTLVLMNVVFAASGCSAAGVRVDRANSLVSGLANLSSILHVRELSIALYVLNLLPLLNVDSTAFALLE